MSDVGDIQKQIVIGGIAGLLFSIALVAMMFATGQTFGQRCAKVYPDKDGEWRECVRRLENGGTE